MIIKFLENNQPFSILGNKISISEQHGGFLKAKFLLLLLTLALCKGAWQNKEDETLRIVIIFLYMPATLCWICLLIWSGSQSEQFEDVRL